MIQFTKIQIDGYGIYRDFTLEDLSPGLNVVVGDNEAGKSTFHSFVVNVLFGFLDRRFKANQYDPVDGGPRGGRLVFEKDGLGPYVVERDESGGLLRFPDGSERDVGDVIHLLGATSREVFEQVFAFSLKELQELDLLSRDQIKNAVYSAGMGGGALRVVNARKTIADALDDMYKPRARKPSINVLLKKFEDVERDVRSLRSEPETYQALAAELERDVENKAELTARNARNRAKLDTVKRLTGAWDAWLAYKKVEQQLTELPDVEDFPADGLERFNQAERERRGITEQIEERRAKLAAVNERLKSSEIDENLLRRSDGIEELGKTVELHKRDRVAVDSLERDLSERKRQIERELRELGPAWNENMVEEFDLSISIKKRIQEAVRGLTEAETARDELSRRFSEAENAVAAVERIEAELNAKLADIGDVQENVHVGKVDRLERQLDVYQERLGRIELLERDSRYRSDDLEKLIAEAGSSWNLERLEGFNFSIDDADHLENVEKSIERTARDLAGLDKAIALEEERRGVMSDRLAEVNEQLEGKKGEGVGEADELKRKKMGLRRLRPLWMEMNQCRTMIDRLTSKTETAEGSDGVGILRRGATALALVGVILMGTLPFFGAAWEVTILAGGLTLGLGLVLFALTARRSVSSASVGDADELARCRARLAELERECGELANEIGEIEAEPEDAGALNRLEDALEERLETSRERKILLARKEEVERDLLVSDKRLDDMRTQRRDDTEEDAAVRGDWRTWLSDNGLPESLSPTKARDLIQRLRAGKDTARELTRLRDELDGNRAETNRYGGEVAEVAKALNVSSSESEEVPILMEKIAAVSRQIAGKLDERCELEKDLAKTREELKRGRDELKQRQKELEASRRGVDALRSEWRKQLEAINLSPDLSLGIIGDLFHKIETARSEIDNKNDLAATLEEIRGRVARFQNDVETLATDLKRPVPKNDEMVERVEAWTREARRSLTERATLDELRETIKGLELELDAKSRSLKALDEEVASLFEAAGVDDEETFRRRAELARRHSELEAMKRELSLRLLQACGDESRMNEFERRLSETSLESLTENRAELEAEIIDADAEIGVIAERIGEKRNELKRLEASEELSALTFEREKLSAQLERQTRRWCVLTIAERMIDKARRKYERERRPDVLKEAEAYFSTLTGGEYPRLRSPMGEETITVINRKDRGLEVDQLSRGAAEQLYLALRFGFIKEYARKAVALPLFLDDILVNFDPKRTRAAASLLTQLAGEHQIFMLTCHPAIVDIFKKTKSKGINFINLNSTSNGKIVGKRQ